MPRYWHYKLRLISEEGHGPTNYYFETRYHVTVSPYETIKLNQNHPSQIQSHVYHPLVTVQISECTKNIFSILLFVANSGVKNSPTTSTTNTTDMVSHIFLLLTCNLILFHTVLHYCCEHRHWTSVISYCRCECWCGRCFCATGSSECAGSGSVLCVEKAPFQNGAALPQ